MLIFQIFLAPRTPIIKFCKIKKKSYPPHNINGEKWCIQKNPKSTNPLVFSWVGLRRECEVLKLICASFYKYPCFLATNFFAFD